MFHILFRLCVSAFFWQYTSFCENPHEGSVWLCDPKRHPLMTCRKWNRVVRERIRSVLMFVISYESTYSREKIHQFAQSSNDRLHLPLSRFHNNWLRIQMCLKEQVLCDCEGCEKWVRGLVWMRQTQEFTQPDDIAILDKLDLPLIITLVTPRPCHNPVIVVILVWIRSHLLLPRTSGISLDVRMQKSTRARIIFDGHGGSVCQFYFWVSKPGTNPKD